MKTELQAKLLKKYPQFFTTTREIYIGREDMGVEMAKLLNQKAIVLPIQFGFECGNGWYMLLDQLMGEIENHLQNVNRNNKNKFKYQWMWNLQRWLRVRTSAKQTRLRSLGDWIYEKAPRKNMPEVTVQIDQIKEKFGGLRFYYSGGDDDIDGMVSLAESLSYHICETCGSTLNIGYTKGWIATMCQSCYEKHPKKDTMIWELAKQK